MPAKLLLRTWIDFNCSGLFAGKPRSNRMYVAVESYTSRCFLNCPGGMPWALRKRREK
jgi:hypothetical protein